MSWRARHKRACSVLFSASLVIALAGLAARAVATNPLGIPDAEYSALTSLYNHTDGTYWDDNTNWFTSSTPWYGVTVESGHVTRIELPHNRLQFHLPDSLGNLTELQVLDLSVNYLTEPIPASLGSLSNLQLLKLNQNIFTGSIPAELGNLSSLQDLQLNWNVLTGPIPSSFGNLANLQTLQLSDNELSGSIPAELGNLANLQELDCAYNSLSGSMPSTLGNLTGLTRLILSSNELTGSIPASFGGLTNLEELQLSVNSLSGPIPSELGDMASLETLNLTTNQLTGSIPGELGDLAQLRDLSLERNQLTGTIPDQLGNLSALEYLQLTTNQLTGPVPTSLMNLTGLFDLGLGENQLSGAIPTSVGNLVNLDYLDLSHNQLAGEIPTSVGSLIDLNDLYLDNNMLSGEIPTSLGYIPHLMEIRLNDNELTGTIPWTIGNLAYLWWLELQNNHLSGTIPASLGYLTQLSCIRLGNNQFSGSIPAELGNLPYLAYLHLEGNQLIGDVPSSITNLIYADFKLSHNRLTASDPAVISFLEQKAPGWDQTQTVRPAVDSAMVAACNSVALSWTPIEYAADAGYYEVGFSATSGGPYTYLPQHRTADKSASSLTASGLPDGDTYYLVVRTVTLPHEHNQSTLTSSQSVEVIAEASVLSKLGADDTAVEVRNSVVTASFADCFYVESQDRSCGIRIVAPGQPVPPGQADIAGTMRTNDSGERYVEAISVLDSGPGAVTALCLPNRTIGGSDWHWNETTGAGQRGVKDGTGLNNIGLLVSTAGAVTGFEPVTPPASPTWFVIDDGSQTQIKCVVPAGVTVDEGWVYVSVTGISSCEKVDDELYRVVRIRSQADIVCIL